MIGEAIATERWVHAQLKTLYARIEDLEMQLLMDSREEE